MQEELLYIGQRRVLLKYVLPLSEVVVDLYDQIKSVSSGYARSVSLVFCNRAFKWFSYSTFISASLFS